MNPAVTGSLAVIAYLAATAALVRSLSTDFIATPASGWPRLHILALGWLALLLHGLSLSGMCDGAGTVNFNFLSVSSLAALSIVTVLLLVSISKPVDKLGVIIFPVAALMVLLKLLLPEDVRMLKTHSWQMNLHILVSMLAYSFLNIAALQAVLVAFQDWHLRTRHGTTLVRSLPPLQTMETLLFQLITTGWVLLCISLLSGFVFVEDLFAQHLAHKTVLSILAWVVFGVLLVGRTRYGWRGQIAIRWTIGGFLALMLAYFGSKFVLELILDRT